MRSKGLTKTNEDLEITLKQYRKKLEEFVLIPSSFNHYSKNPDQVTKQMKKLITQEKVLRNVIAKLENTEEATLVYLSCNKCFELIDDPITCVPCGHNYCKKCTTGYENDTCKQCKDVVEHLLRNENLKSIISKAKYKQQLFKALSS